MQFLKYGDMTKMAWSKAGTTTLGSAGANVEITSLPTNKFNQILAHNLMSTNAAQDFTFNSSTGSLYATRKNLNGTIPDPTPLVNQSFVEMRYNSSEDYFHVMDSCWISGEEKLSMSHHVSNQSAGAGYAPYSGEYAFKYVPASLTDTITAVKFNKGSFTNYATDSNISALGSDGDLYVVQDGAIFYETDTNKSYVLNSGTWTEL